MDINSPSDPKKRFRDGISWVLSFFLSLFFALLLMILLIKTTILSPDFFKNQVDKSNYVQYIIEDMEEYFISYGMTAGFDEAFFTSVLQEQSVKNDVYTEINKIFNNGSEVTDIEAFKSMLYQKMLSNLESRKIEITPTEEEALQYLIKICAQTYLDGVQLPVASYATSMIKFAEKPVLFAGIGVAVMMLLLMLFLFSIQRHHKLESFRYCIYAFSGATLTFGVPVIIIAFLNKIDKIGITSKSLYYLVTTYFNSVLMKALLLIACLALIVVVFILLYFLLKNKYKSKHCSNFEQQV